jgi:hypothetical protein
LSSIPVNPDTYPQVASNGEISLNGSIIGQVSPNSDGTFGYSLVNGTAGTNGLPISAASQNGAVIYTFSDGAQAIQSGESISWRDNNPGNMVAGAGGNNPIGYNSGFAIFLDTQTGYDAMTANLDTSRYQSLTIGAINTWAPASGGNDPVTYSNNVQSWTGLPANTPLNSLSPAQIDSVANAIQRQEGWGPGTITNVPALAGHANGVQ